MASIANRFRDYQVGAREAGGVNMLPWRGDLQFTAITVSNMHPNALTNPIFLDGPILPPEQHCAIGTH